MKEQGIEEIFKTAFDNLESDVDPSVWTNVQQAINAPMTGPSGHGANGSIAGKAGAVVAKLGVKSIIAIVTAATGVSVGSYFLFSNSQSQKTIPSIVQSQPQLLYTSPAPVTTTAHETGSPSSNSPSVTHENKSEKKTTGEEKSDAVLSPDVASQPLPATPTSSSGNNLVNSPAVPSPGSAKSEPSKSISTSAEMAKNDNTKPLEEANATVNHTYQNDFADINNYLEPEVTSETGLPNIFSPNGDGKNDAFTIKTKNLKTLAVTVFDQSGKLVYQWNGLDGAWDGNLADGRPAPVGNYYYSLLAESTDGKKCIASSYLVLRR